MEGAKVERKVKGKVLNWARDVKQVGVSQFRSRGVCLLENGKEVWHNIIAFGESGAEDLRVMNVTYPEQVSFIEFVEVQKGKYWNFKQGSLQAVIPEVDAVPDVVLPKDRKPVQQADSRSDDILKQVCLKVAADVCRINADIRVRVALESNEPESEGDILQHCIITPKRLMSQAKRIYAGFKHWDVIPDVDDGWDNQEGAK